MTRRFEATIRGVVQGVLFRQSAWAEACRFGICGSARNRPDGTVRVVAEGDEAKLREFLGWLQHGPDRAVVERVDVDWSDARGEPLGFRIEG